MSFQPRHLADGRICCSQEYALCDKCKSLRAAAAAPDYTPPDPYQKGIAELREVLGKSEPATPPAPPKDFTPPNPYAAGIAALRQDKDNR